MKKHLSESGFTLLEMMTVVAIIGILAAVAVPKFGDYKKKSSDYAVENTAKNIINACNQCFNSKLDCEVIQNSIENTHWKSINCTGQEDSQLDLSSNDDVEFDLYSNYINNSLLFLSIRSLEGSSIFCYDSRKSGQPFKYKPVSDWAAIGIDVNSGYCYDNLFNRQVSKILLP